MHELIEITTQDQKRDAGYVHHMPGSEMRSEPHTTAELRHLDHPPHIHQVGIADYQRASSNCKIGCICTCHAPRRLRISGCHWLLGILSVTVSGTSANQSRCNETSCSRRSTAFTRVTYRFPMWFLRRAICLTIGVQESGCLNATLKMPRIVPDNADIMQFAKVGNLSNVRSLIEQNLASPLDVNSSWDVPVLSVSRILMTFKMNWKCILVRG